MWPVGRKYFLSIFRPLRRRHSTQKRFWGQSPKFLETARRKKQPPFYDKLLSFYFTNSAKSLSTTKWLHIKRMYDSKSQKKFYYDLYLDPLCSKFIFIFRKTVYKDKTFTDYFSLFYDSIVVYFSIFAILFFCWFLSEI